jgi:hypothetical protein
LSDLSTAVDLLSAEEQALEGLQESLSEQEANLAQPIKTLQKHLADEIDKLDKLIVKQNKKLKASINKQQAKTGNDIEAIISALMSQLFIGIADNESTLGQLSIKSGAINVGDSMDKVGADKPEPGSGQQWGGVLVLSVKEAIPHIKELIEVLKEIRDRIPGFPIEYKGEVPAKEAESEELPSDTEDDADIDMTMIKEPTL